MTNSAVSRDKYITLQSSTPLHGGRWSGAVGVGKQSNTPVINKYIVVLALQDMAGYGRTMCISQTLPGHRSVSSVTGDSLYYTIV